jgi:hypothetical protein
MAAPRQLACVVICALLSVGMVSHLASAQALSPPTLADGQAPASSRGYAVGWCSTGAKGTLSVSGVGLQKAPSDQAQVSQDSVFARGMQANVSHSSLLNLSLLYLREPAVVELVRTVGQGLFHEQHVPRV